MTDAHRPERPQAGVTPFLTIREGRGSQALDFYERAFGAMVTERNLAEDGSRLMQAGLKINGGFVMMADEFLEWMPATPPPAAVTLHLQVDDADRWFGRAVEAGCTILMPLANQFWGDRYGWLADPFGHRWSVGSTIAPGRG